MTITAHEQTAVERPSNNTIVADALRYLANRIEKSGTPLPAYHISVTGAMHSVDDVRTAASMLGGTYTVDPVRDKLHHVAELVAVGRRWPEKHTGVTLRFTKVVDNPPVVAAVLAPDDARLPADEPAATFEQAEACRAELQAAIEALDVHEFVSTHVVEGAATGAWWVEIRAADDTQILRLAVHDTLWLVGDEVVGSLTDASPSTVAMFVTGWLESAARTDQLPAEEPKGEPAAEVERPWFFTFGANHTHPVTGESLGNSYVQLHGTCDATRAQMIAVFGKQWAMQYVAADLEPGQPVPVGGAAGVKRFGLTRIELPVAERTPRTWKAGQAIPTDVQAVTDSDACDPGVWRRVVGQAWQFCRAGSTVQLGYVAEDRMLAQYGPVTEVLPGASA
jgi:hypothetical protein